MNIEQKKRIVEGAPAGSTHAVVFSSYVEYYGLNKPYDSRSVALLHNLSDLRTIIAQSEEIERLRLFLARYHYQIKGGEAVQKYIVEKALQPPKGEYE